MNDRTTQEETRQLPTQGQADAPRDQKAGGSVISGVQVMASALAAATSFALSAQIGLAGSLIGAVIGAAASSVALQAYTKLLSASAEKIRSTASGADDDGAARTQVRRRPVTYSDETVVSEFAQTGTPVAPDEIRQAAARRERTRTQRRTAAIVAVAGVATVLVFALVVNLATSGNGIGTKPTYAPVQTTQEEASAKDKDEEASGASEDDTATGTTGTTDASEDGTATGTADGSSSASDSGQSGSAQSGSGQSGSAQSPTTDSGSTAGGTDGASGTTADGAGGSSASGGTGTGGSSSSDDGSSGGSSATNGATSSGAASGDQTQATTDKGTTATN